MKTFTWIGLMMLLALTVRAHELDQPIVRFHPTRHYRSAVIARACYYDHAPDVPDWARKVADANRTMQQAGEPPLMEWAACGAYLALGHENIMIPRALAVVIWVGGAIPLWLLTMRLASPFGAALAVALYLFLPYGIIASQNFQPDPLMTVASLWAILALVRYHDDRSGKRFLTAAALVGLAGVIKPMSVFLTVPAIAAIEYVGRGPFKQRVTKALELGFVGLVVPVFVYGYSAVKGTLVQDQMRMRFEPQLIPTAFFWGGLGRMISRVETWPILVLALIGMAVAKDRLARWLLLALFAGYFAFAVAFTYHMPTHDYYHLPYIPVVALGVGVLLARLESFVDSLRVRQVATAVLCAATIAIGTMVAWPRMHLDDAAGFEQMYEEIGALTEHKTNSLFLDTEYGFAMMYHGQISGDSWPNVDDLAAEAIDGRPAIDAEQRFMRDYAGWQPSYFIVTDLYSLDEEKDLQAMLAKKAIPVRITDRYRVYRFKAD
jgi:hypothetical protein